MNKLIILFLAIICLVVQPLSAQTNEQNNYKYHKAIELIESDGDLKQVRKLLNENISENPKHISSYVTLVQVDMHDGDYGAALAGIEKAIKLNYWKSGTSNALLQWWKAVIFEDMGKMERAIPIMEGAVKMARKDDKDNLVHMLDDLADMYFSQKNYSAADGLYNEMLKLDEGSQKPMLGLARNMNAREQYEDALKMIEECMKLNAENPNIYKLQVNAYEGLKEYKKMIDAMVQLYEKSENIDYLDVGRMKMDKKYAVAVIKEKITHSNENIVWKACLADLYEKCYDYANALNLLDIMIAEYNSEHELYCSRAMYYSELGIMDRALEDIGKSIELSGEEDAAYYCAKRGEIYRKNGDYENAIKDIGVYIESFPTAAVGYYLRGWCKELRGDDKGAMEDYEQGIAVDESYAYIYLMRGEMNLKWGNDSLAKADFEKVLQKDTVVEAGSYRQYALHFLGNDVEALQWMEKLIADDPADAGRWYDKACLLSRMGRCEEAVEALNTAFEKGYRNFAHLEHDDDMDPVRGRDDYRELVAKYKGIHKEETAKFKVVDKKDEVAVVSEIGMRKMYSGTYEIPCQVNGLPLKMIFDTGASDVTISSVEASFMFKNGYLNENDVKGKKHYMTASGDIHEGTILKLKEVKLGEAVLKNIEASVVGNQKAPLLLGQSVLEKFCTITIDNINSTLKIKH
jgi:clan AA aspartic protease (TIGR02281 family)